DPATVGKSGKAEHHERRIGGRRVARGRDQPAESTAREVEILRSRGKLAAGDGNDRKSGQGIKGDRDPDQKRTHLPSSFSRRLASASQRMTTATRVTQVTAPRTTQNRKAPLQVSFFDRRR